MKSFSGIKHHSTIATENIKPKSEGKQEGIEGCTIIYPLGNYQL